MQKLPARLLILSMTMLAAWTYASNEMNDALKRKPDRRHGQKLYENCAGCHQPDGSGVAAQGIPSIAGQHYRVILKQLTDFRDTERLDLRMEAAVSRHHLSSAQDLADVAFYIARLPVRNTMESGPVKHAPAGKLAYDRSCAHCHGKTGEGNGQLRYPRLAGQHYTYLIKQIDTMVGGSRFNVSWDHAQMLTGLTDEEMMGVAEHLARLGSLPGKNPPER